MDFHARVPVNKMAAIVTSEKPAPSWDKKIVNVHTDGILPTVDKKDWQQWQQLKKLKGKKFGYFTVIGIAPKEISNSRRCMYVVRCVCGAYETRSNKAINNPKNNQDRCGACLYKVELLRKAQYRDLGRNIT